MHFKGIGGSEGKESACNMGDLGSIPGSGNPLDKYSCLDNPMDGGAWQAIVHGVTKVRHHLATKTKPRYLESSKP